MNNEVIAKARELALLIASSQEYIVMRATEDAASQDEGMVEAAARYSELHTRLEEVTAQDNPDFDKMGELTRQMEAIQQEIQSQPLAAALKKARGDFNAMMQSVNETLSAVLAPEGAGCTGNCSSCGGSCKH